jgi:hypothetical protein
MYLIITSCMCFCTMTKKIPCSCLLNSIMLGGLGGRISCGDGFVCNVTDSFQIMEELFL